MLKKLLTLTLVFVGILTLAACDNTPEGPTDLEKLAEALVEIDLPSETATDLTFPSSGLHDVTVTWESSNTDVIANDGTVTIPTFTEGNKTVTITAYVTIGDNTLTKEFTVAVNAAATKTDAEKVADAKNALLLADTIVISDMTLVATALEATVTWSSDMPAYIANDGTVVRPDDATGNVVVTLTATITVGEATDTKEFSITVQAEEGATVYTSIQAMYDAAILNDYIEFTGIVTGVFDGGYFLSDGTLALGVYAGSNDLNPALGDNVKVRGFYAVYNTLYQLSNITSEEVLSSGNTNPLVGTETVVSVEELLAVDSSVASIHGAYYTVTGTVELQGTYENVYLVDGDFAVLVYYYSLEASLDALVAQVGKEITITVFYYTDHGTNGPMVAYDGGEAGITVNTLPDADALAADVEALLTLVPGITLESITLPTEGPNGTMFSAWTSSDVAVLGNDGVFAALGASTTVVTFTGTATKGDLTETVTVDVVVPLNSTVAEVLAMDDDAYFQVSGIVYDISYYGLFIEQGGDFIFVYYKQYDGAIVVGDEIQMLGMRDSYSGLAQIALIGDMTVLSSSNAVPTAVVSTSSAIANDLVPRGTVATITGTVGVDAANYDNIIITDAAGGVVTVYYRSNASEFDTVVGSIVTVEVISYQNDTVLYSKLLADITVETAFTDAQKAQMAADYIDLGMIDAVEMDLTLPVENTMAGATIVWTTSDAAVVGLDGVVTRVAGSDTMVTLGATVTVGAESVTRDIMVKVIDANNSNPLSVTEALLEADGTSVLVKGVIIGGYYDERIIQDSTGAALYLDSNVGGDLGDEIVVRGTLGLNTSYGDNQRELNSVALIETLSTGNALVLSTETDPAVIVTEVPSMFRYTATLTVSTLDDGFGYVHFTGDGTVFLKFKKSAEVPYFDDIYELGDSIEMTFTVSDIDFDNARIVSVEMPALTDAEALTAAVGGTEVPANTTTDLTLGTEMYGVAIAWSSDNAAITDMGVVTRPANGVGDATVTLTAVYTIGVETQTETYTVVVAEEMPPAATLFISEYIEGSSNNKAIEIYNPNAFDVVMTGYKVGLYSNGSDTIGNNIDLSSYTIAANSVFVITNSSANAAIAAESDETSTITYFNGDDAVALLLDDAVVDVIGVIGTDPGSEWVVGTGSTSNNTLVRNSSVTVGVTTFDAAEWTVLATDDSSDLGSHTTD